MKLFYVTCIVMLLSMISETAHARKPKVVVDVIEEYSNKELPANGTVWYCAYDGAAGINCLLGETRADAQMATGSATSTTIDSRLPELVRTVWHNASQLAGKVITIPMHTVPFDWPLVGELAESVMCGGTKTPCGVIFAKSKVFLSAMVSQRKQQFAAVGSMQLGFAQ